MRRVKLCSGLALCAARDTQGLTGTAVFYCAFWGGHTCRSAGFLTTRMAALLITSSTTASREGFSAPPGLLPAPLLAQLCHPHGTSDGRLCARS